MIKLDDGLPHGICINCVGRLEFLCDFYNKCHNTQKNLDTTKEPSKPETEVPKDKLESDAESDKENVLPSEHGKRKGKPLQSEHLKISKSTESEESTILQGVDLPSDLPTEKTSIPDNLPDNDKRTESAPRKLEEAPFDDFADLCHEKENIADVKDDNSVMEAAKNLVQLSKAAKSNAKKAVRRAKIVAECKNKKLDGKRTSNTIDKYMTIQSQCKIKNVNEENIDPNPSESNNDEENVIFEGTVINSTGDTSIIIPLKSESFNEELNLNNSMMADGSEIVQARDIVWITGNVQLPEAEKPNTAQTSTNQTENVSSAADNVDSAEQTNIVQTSNDETSKNSVEKLLLVEVQLSAKDNLPKNVTSLKKKRSVSSSSSERRRSEAKYGRISELLTEEQKQEIEKHYTIDKSLVDESKVNDYVVFLGKSEYKCKNCKNSYPRLDKCQVHIWRHLKMKPFLCKLCKFSTLTVSNIRCHIRKSHLKIKPFECHICKKCYNSATLLEEHINVHTGQRPHQCQLCDFASTSKQVLSHHLLIHKEKKDIECDICGKKFYAKSRMRAHRIVHDKKRTNKCNLCSAYISNENSLERHYESVHTKDYICKICNKVYKSKKALHNHESVHSEAKFKCSLCPNVYKSTHILKEHLLKHQGIRKYQCKKCNKNFAQQSHLAAHMAVHSNVTYNCPGCNKGFNRHDNMKVHTKRCEQFLANPELKSLLTKRKISFSKNNTAKVSIQKNNSNYSETEETNDMISNDHIEETAVDTSVTASIDLKDKVILAVTENVLSTDEF